jgi:hypothetical protein
MKENIFEHPDKSIFKDTVIKPDLRFCFTQIGLAAFNLLLMVFVFKDEEIDITKSLKLTAQYSILIVV